MKIMAALDLSDYADFVLIKAIKTAKQQNAKMDIVVVAEDRSNEIGSAVIISFGADLAENLSAPRAG